MKTMDAGAAEIEIAAKAGANVVFDSRLFAGYMYQ